MFVHICSNCFLYCQVWYKLGFSQWFPRDWIKLTHLECNKDEKMLETYKTMTATKFEKHSIKSICHLIKMIKDHCPLISNPTWSNDRISKNIKSYFATQVIRDLKYLISISNNNREACNDLKRSK